MQWNEGLAADQHLGRRRRLPSRPSTAGLGPLINAAPSHAKAAWEGPILFDKYIRDALRGRTRTAQLTAANLSDVFYKGMVLTPYIVDNYITALGVHQNADVALQMTVIDMQSLGLSGVLTLAAEHAVGRQRPYVAGCQGPDGTDKVGFNYCGGADDFKSFYSGHAAAMFTMVRGSRACIISTCRSTAAACRTRSRA